MFSFQLAAFFILSTITGLRWKVLHKGTLFTSFFEVIFNPSLPDFPVLDLSVCCRCCEGKR